MSVLVSQRSGSSRRSSIQRRRALGRYRVLRPTKYRAGCEMDSEELGALTEGWVIKVRGAHTCLLEALSAPSRFVYGRFVEPFRPAVSSVTVLAQPFRPAVFAISVPPLRPGWRSRAGSREDRARGQQ